MKIVSFGEMFFAYPEKYKDKIEQLSEYESLSTVYNGENYTPLHELLVKISKQVPEAMLWAASFFYPEGVWVAFYSPSGAEEVDELNPEIASSGIQKAFEDESAFVRAVLFYPDALDWEKYANAIREKKKTVSKSSSKLSLASLSSLSEAMRRQFPDFDQQITVERFLKTDRKDIVIDFSYGAYSSRDLIWPEQICVPSGVTSLVFRYAYRVKNILIPNSVTNIDVPTEHVKYLKQNDILIRGEKGTAAQQFALQNGLRFEEAAQTVEKKASMKKPKMPKFFLAKKMEVEVDGDSIMGAYFEDSSRHIQIETGAIRVGRSSFCLCRKLESIFFPPTVEEIGRQSFQNCDNLVDVYLPKSLKRIKEPWWEEKKLVFHVQEKSYAERYAKKNGIRILYDYEDMAKALGIDAQKYNALEPDSGGFIIQDKTLIRYKGKNPEVVVPDSVEKIADSAFANAKIQSVVIPDSVREIEKKAFDSCRNLTTVTLPNSITMIPDMAFCGCISLKALQIPQSVRTIGEHAFCSCEGLESVVIPDSVICIEKGAFSKCTTLKSVEMTDSVTEIGDRAFALCKNLKDIKLSSRITRIAAELFEHCENLRSVILPNDLHEMGSRAFHYCSALTEIFIPKSVTKFGKEIAAYCKNLKDITIPASITETDMAYLFGFFGRSKSLTIHAPKGSAAEAYAKQFQIAFQEFEF